MAEQLVGDVADVAIEAIDWIMEREDVPTLSPFGEKIARTIDHHIARNADFSTVMQYLWTFVGNGAPIRRAGNSAQYRYNFYKGSLTLWESAEIEGNIQHIDLGCGGGTFAHALLEWCQARGVEFNKITLYGYDYAPKMIKAARMIHGLIRNWHTGDIPNLNAYDDYGLMLEEIPANPIEPTHYIITAGYVIAGNNNDQTIGDFTSIIAEVVREAGGHPCSLIICDSNTVRPLAPAYNRLTESLLANGVNVNTHTNTLNSSDRRIAELHIQGD